MCVHQLDNKVFDIIDARCDNEVYPSFIFEFVHDPFPYQILNKELQQLISHLQLIQS